MTVLLFDGSCADGTKHAYQIEQAAPEEHSSGSGPPSTLPTEGTRITLSKTELPSSPVILRPGGASEYRVRSEYLAGDAEVPAAAGQRAELQRYSPFVLPGTHIWLTEYFRVVERDSTHYMLVRQFHEEEPDIGVAVGLYIESTEMKLKAGAGSSWFIGGFELNHWYRLKLHLKIHQTEGVIELWLDGVKQTLQNGKQSYENANTLNGSNPGGATKVYDKVGFLRSKEAIGNTKVDHYETLVWEGTEDPESSTTTPSGLVVPSRRAVRGLLLR